MPRYFKSAFFLSLLLSAGCLPVQAQPPASQPRDVLIVYSGQALGELKPCGCTREEDQGGIERRMGYFKNALPPAGHILRVDLGDNFKEPSQQGRLKARTMGEAMTQMHYDAVVLGEKDLVYGTEFVTALPALPWVSANLFVPGWRPPPFRIKTFDDGLKVALVSVADPDLFYAGLHGQTKMNDPQKTLERLLPQLRHDQQPDLTVLLTHMDRSKALALLEMAAVDVVINGHIRDAEDLVDFEPVRRGGKIFLQPGPRGQKMGELRVTLHADGSKTFRQRMVKLDSKIPMDPEMTRLYARYNEQVEALFLESLQAKRERKKSVYATETACQTCHAEAHATWARSRHGHAYATLEKVNKAFDPECLACHTTGFNRPGGFISEVDTPELENVQCEVCHGPRRDHARSPAGGFAREARKACGRCHVSSHSPNFNYGTYWPKIAH